MPSPLNVLKNERVRRYLVWAMLIGAVAVGVAVAPPTREEPVSWVGWTDA